MRLAVTVTGVCRRGSFVVAGGSPLTWCFLVSGIGLACWSWFLKVAESTVQKECRMVESARLGQWCWWKTGWGRCLVGVGNLMYLQGHHPASPWAGDTYSQVAVGLTGWTGGGQQDANFLKNHRKEKVLGYLCCKNIQSHRQNTAAPDNGC